MSIEYISSLKLSFDAYNALIYGIMRFSDLDKNPCGQWTRNRKSIWSGLNIVTELQTLVMHSNNVSLAL